MRNSLFWFVLILLFVVRTQVHAGDAQGPDRQRKSRPNVIIVLSDDQGYGDFSCHGNPVLKTPHLDRLHNESIRFSDFHVSPLCTPTRGQLLTGLDAMRNGAATVLTGRNILKRDLTTMPEIFAANGYATGIFGKWHLGDNYPDRPMDKGFQKSVWHKGWGLLSEIEYDNDYYETRYLDSLETKMSGTYCTNLWFNESMAWMDEVSTTGQPFFTYLALNAPHGPFFSPVQDYTYYRDQRVDSTSALFLGMIRNIDRNMGRLEDWLERRGLKENTIVVYLTDNGGTGGVNVYNAGMRDKKGSNYEGGHRAACFIRWTGGQLDAANTVEYPAQVQDLLPTFIELLGLASDHRQAYDGISLLPLLRSAEAQMPDRMFVVQHGGQTRPEKYFSCVVWKSWRLVGKNELYNIEQDSAQRTNVIDEFTDIANSMRAFYEAWWRTVEGDVDQFIPHVIDSEKQNPVILNASNWTEGAINSQWRIARGEGSERGGVIPVQIVKDGRYRISLSRWPFHMQRDMTLPGPRTNIGGSSIRVGRGLPIFYGCFSINDQKAIVIEKQADHDVEISCEREIPAGEVHLRAWFRDQSQQDIVGAYYVRIERLLE